MAHAIIEHAQRELPGAGYEVQPIGGVNEPMQLLVKTEADFAGRERWLLLTAYDDLMDDTDETRIVQIFYRFPAEAPAPADRGDFARLLVAVNNVITIGQFCYREEDALLYFRALVMLPAAPDSWTTLLNDHLSLAAFQIDQFGLAIESSAIGAQTVQAAIAADPRLGTLPQA